MTRISLRPASSRPPGGRFRPRGRSRGTTWALAAAVWLGGAWATSAAAADLGTGALLAACEVNSIAPGEAAAAWSLVRGFVPDERAGRRFAWLDGEAVAVPLLAPAGSRVLRVEAKGTRPGLTFEVSLNGVEVGAGTVSRSWGRFAWTVSAEAIRAGPNRLELSPSHFRRSKKGRTSGIAVAAIELEPAGRCRLAAHEIAPPPPGESVGLPPGAFLVAPLAGDEPPRRVEIAFRGAWPNTSLTLFCHGADRVQRIAVLTAGRGARRRAVDTVELPAACARSTTLTLAAGGPEWANLESLAFVETRFWGWRERQRAALAGMVLLVGLLAAGTARLGVRLPFDRFAPWLDVVLLTAVALVIRLWFLRHYPYPGFSGDIGEYVDGARALAADWSRLWSTTDWHAWQTYFRPPGYYLFLAAIFGPLGGDREIVLLLQACLSAVACGAIYLIAYPLFGRGAAIAAGALLTAYVGSVATFTRILTEPLYMGLLLPALAALAWSCRRPSWPAAAAAGSLFALAALVRPAPVQYVPLAAVLLLAIHGRRRGVRPAAALVLSMAVLLAPWYLRSARIHGYWVGLETVSTANLLQFNPDDRFVPASHLDLTDADEFSDYYERLKKANADGALARRRGEVTRAVVAAKLRHPGATARRFAANAAAFVRPVPDSYLRWILSEHDSRRIARLIDLWNLELLVIVALGAGGLVANLRDRRTWPLTLWYLFNFAVMTVLVHVAVRYRFGILPVLMVFAGWTIARGLDRLRPRTGRG